MKPWRKTKDPNSNIQMAMQDPAVRGLTKSILRLAQDRDPVDAWKDVMLAGELLKDRMDFLLYGEFRDTGATPEHIREARRLYQSADVEIDDDAEVSVAGDNCGVWVAAWVWVDCESLATGGESEEGGEQG